MARRPKYSEKKKKEVVEFVKKFDAQNNGRGGQAAARKKWGINPITIKSWCVQAGYGTSSRSKKRTTTKSRPAKKKAPVRKVATAAKSAAAPVKSGSTAATLAKMASIQDKIDKLQGEFNSLKAQL